MVDKYTFIAMDLDLIIQKSENNQILNCDLRNRRIIIFYLDKQIRIYKKKII